MTIIGIDLGNKYTKVYCIKNGRAEAVFTESSERKFLSAVTLKSQERIVGNYSSISRNFSDSFSNIIELIYDSQKAISHDQLDNNNSKIHLLVVFFNYIKKIVNSSLIECVISISGNLDKNIKSLISSACTIVNFNLLGIINSNLASALGYGFFKILKKEYTKPVTAIFYNIGDCNSNFSIIEFEENTIKHISNISCKIGVGCIDQYLMDICLNHIIKNHDIHLQLHTKAYMSLLQKCQKSKQILSSNTMTFINSDFFLPEKEFNINIKITQEDLNSFIQKNIVPNIIQTFDTLLSHSNISKFDLLVPSGGGSRIPLISEKISKHFDKPLNKIIDIDESVAKGCSLYGGLHSDNIKTGANIKIKYRNVENIVVDFIGSDDQIFKQIILLEKNDYYPVEKLISFKRPILLKSNKLLVFDNSKKLLSTIMLPQDLNLVEKDILQIKMQIDKHRIINLISCKIKHPLSVSEIQKLQEEENKVAENKAAVEQKAAAENKGAVEQKAAAVNKGAVENKTVVEKTNHEKDSTSINTELQDSKVMEKKEAITNLNKNQDSKIILDEIENIKITKKYKKINIPFQNVTETVEVINLENIKNLELKLQKEIHEFKKKNTLLNNLESEYYKIQENFNKTNSGYNIYLNKVEQEEIKNMIQNKLDEIYEKDLSLSEINAYSETLQQKTDKIEYRRKSHYKKEITLDLWNKSYQSYLQDLEKINITPEEFRTKIDKFNNHVIHEYQKELEIPLYIPSKINILEIKNKITDFQNIWKKIQAENNDSMVLENSELTSVKKNTNIETI